MAKITAVRARAVAVPLANVISLSNRTITDRHYGLVEVEADDGRVGIGFCYVGSRGGQVFPQVVAHVLAPVLMGRDVHDVEGAWTAMYQEALLQGRTGTAMRAISAIDIAIWDRNAQAAGLPLYKFLGGGSQTGTVPAYASGGYFLEGKTPAMLADEMRGYLANGFDAVKIKVGRDSDPGRETERVAAARDAIGPDAILMLDANNAWRDLPTALRFIRRFEEYNPYFIEEPFSPDDIDNHVRLTQSTSIPVATGEIEAGRWRFKELLDKEAGIILQTDACVAGGITEFRRIAAMAAGYGVTLCPHWFHDVHIHLVASTPNARYVEYFPDSAVLNFRDLVSDQLEARGGQLVLPQKPGLGFTFLGDNVEKHAITPWL